MNDSPARTDPAETEIGHPTQTARRLVEASVSPNTRRAYAGALRRLDAWLDGRPLHDVTLAAYLAELHDAGRASSSASMRSPRRASARSSLVGRARPVNARPSTGGGRVSSFLRLVLPGARRLPADRQRPRPGPSAAVRSRGFGEQWNGKYG